MYQKSDDHMKISYILELHNLHLSIDAHLFFYDLFTHIRYMYIMGWGFGRNKTNVDTPNSQRENQTTTAYQKKGIRQMLTRKKEKERKNKTIEHTTLCVNISFSTTQCEIIKSSRNILWQR